MGIGSSKNPRLDPSNPARICVVGAGVSGLRCADILLRHGFNVTILEARDRIGGRMHQITLPSGRLVDLGPNWIHGTKNNPIIDIVKETETAIYDWGKPSKVFDENGMLLKDGDNLSCVFWDIILKAFEYSKEKTKAIDPNESLYNFVVKEVEEVLPGVEAKHERKIVLQISELWGTIVGRPIQRQSLKFFWLEECIDAENVFCAGTYQKVLTHIAKNAVTGADVKLRTQVTGVNTIKEGMVTISTSSGPNLEFDEVVMTTPLGWLKKHQNVFNPALPQRFNEAVDAIDYGSLEKVYITFPRAFWLGEEGKPDKDPFTGSISWISPTYAPDTNPQKWHQEIVDLATLPSPCAHPTLLFYLYGDHSTTLASQLSTLPSQSQRDEHLIKFFKPYYSLLPHYNKASNDCKPVSCLATTWVLDEFAGNGSYCAFGTGLKEGDRDIEVLREGLPERNVWFAGEHTSPFLALGTVTGAYLSGEAVGNRLAEKYGKIKLEGGALNAEDVAGGKATKELL